MKNVLEAYKKCSSRCMSEKKGIQTLKFGGSIMAGTNNNYDNKTNNNSQNSQNSQNSTNNSSENNQKNCKNSTNNNNNNK